MSLKIYTKTGDEGKTSLLGGTKVYKSNFQIEAYGTIDELNSHIGLVRSYVDEINSNSFLSEIQNTLFIIGSLLACDTEKEVKINLPEITEASVEKIEQAIDIMDEQLPALKNFILPAGNTSISAIHVARCVCRRAERCCVSIKEHNYFIQPLIIKYLNRLSDYLFVLARFTAKNLNVSEIEWKHN